MADRDVLMVQVEALEGLVTHWLCLHSFELLIKKRKSKKKSEDDVTECMQLAVDITTEALKKKKASAELIDEVLLHQQQIFNRVLDKLNQEMDFLHALADAEKGRRN